MLLCWCFTAAWHFSGYFWHGQLTYPHRSWATLLGNLPVLKSTFFCQYLTTALLESAEGTEWPIAIKECCQTWGSNLRQSAYQADTHPAELLRPAYVFIENCRKWSFNYHQLSSLSVSLLRQWNSVNRFSTVRPDGRFAFAHFGISFPHFIFFICALFHISFAHENSY